MSGSKFAFGSGLAGFLILFLAVSSVFGQGNSTDFLSFSIKLVLEAQKEVIVKDENGKDKVIWQAVGETAIVQPGDILRYRVRGEETLKVPVNDFVLNQAIPGGTSYVLNSAKVEMQNTGATITYSVDGGKSFTENPTIQVISSNGKVETKPAPAEAYTHIRFRFANGVVPANILAIYQVKVR